MCFNDIPDVSHIPETISATATLPPGHDGLYSLGKDTRDMEGEDVGLFFGTCQKAVIQQSWKVSFTHRCFKILNFSPWCIFQSHLQFRRSNIVHTLQADSHQHQYPEDFKSIKTWTWVTLFRPTPWSPWRTWEELSMRTSTHPRRWLWLSRRVTIEQF